MTPKGRPRGKDEHVVRTTIELPATLWRAAKIKAMDERKDLRSVIVAALEAYLRRTPKRGA